MQYFTDPPTPNVVFYSCPYEDFYNECNSEDTRYKSGFVWHSKSKELVTDELGRAEVIFERVYASYSDNEHIRVTGVGIIFDEKSATFEVLSQ